MQLTLDPADSIAIALAQLRPQEADGIAAAHIAGPGGWCQGCEDGYARLVATHLCPFAAWAAQQKAAHTRSSLSAAVSHRQPTAVGRAKVPTFTGQRSQQTLADGDDLGQAAVFIVSERGRPVAAVPAGAEPLEHLLTRMRTASW